MSEVIQFDTLKFVETLEAGGFTHQQARATAEAFIAATSRELASKDDLARESATIKTELGAKIETTVSEAKADLLKSVIAVVIGAATLNTVAVLVAMFGLAKLLK